MNTALDAPFAEAFIHRLPGGFRLEDPWSEHRVLGKRLRPFCLWHRMLLQAADSPLFKVGGQATARSLLHAVAICRCRYPHTPGRVRFGPLTFWSALGQGTTQAFLAFRDYLEDFGGGPEYTVIPPSTNGRVAPSSGARGSAPDLMRLVSDVVHHLGCPPAQAWQMPYGEAMWWQAMSLREKSLDLDFITPKQRDYHRDLREKAPEVEAAMRAAAQQFREEM